MKTLILAPRYTDNSNALWKAAIDLGWDIMRVTNNSWQLDYIPEDPVIYGEPLFNHFVAEQLGKKVVEPPEDFLVKLPKDYTSRKIEYMTVKEARQLKEAKFIKPPNHKTFPAKVYIDGIELPNHLEDDEMVLVSDPVKFYYEARFFILNRKIITWSPYLIEGHLSFNKKWNRIINLEVKERVFRLLQDKSIDIPDALVIDAGKFYNIRSMPFTGIIETNEVCGSGIYGCNPRMVLRVLEKGLQNGK